MPKETPKRFRAARSDASTGAIEKAITAIFKLPKGSVSIRNPSGGNAKSQKAIGKVRKDYT